MKTKWHQRATVQAALIGAGGLLIAAIITGIIAATSKKEATVSNTYYGNQVIIIPSNDGLDPKRIAEALQSLR